MKYSHEVKYHNRNYTLCIKIQPNSPTNPVFLMIGRNRTVLNPERIHRDIHEPPEMYQGSFIVGPLNERKSLIPPRLLSLRFSNDSKLLRGI